MKKIKNERGVISIIVLASVLLFTTVLLSTYMVISNKIKAQKEIINETRDLYDNGTLEETYGSFFENAQNYIPIYTNEQYLNIATGNPLNINGKYYNFTENDSYMLMSDLEIQENDLPENWIAPETIFIKGDNEGSITYNECIVKIISDGTIIEEYNGEIKLPHQYKKIEYIQSDGNQYIDTGLILGKEFTIKTSFSQTRIISDEQPVISIWNGVSKYFNIFVEKRYKKINFIYRWRPHY